MQLQSRCQIKITEELSVLSCRLKYHDHTQKSLSTHNMTANLQYSLMGPSMAAQQVEQK